MSPLEWMPPDVAAERRRVYERRIWERAVKAIPRGRFRRRLFRWAWRHNMSPPLPADPHARLLLLMTVIELRAIRDGRVFR